MHALREGNTLHVVISPTLTPKLKFKFCLFQQMNELLWKQQFDSRTKDLTDKNNMQRR